MSRYHVDWASWRTDRCEAHEVGRRYLSPDPEGGMEGRYVPVVVHHKTNAIVRKFPPPIRQLVGYSMRLFDVIQWKKKLFKNDKQ